MANQTALSRFIRIAYITQILLFILIAINSIQFWLIKQTVRMSFKRNRDFGSSEDEAFLQNFQSPQLSNDILSDLCKVELPQQDQLPKFYLKEEMQEEQEAQISEKEEKANKSARSKEKKKVFYRDKMAELMRPGEYTKQQYNYVAYSQSEIGRVPISKQEQLKRNRQSAKNSRQRKKEYVSVLEKLNQENEQKIKQLTYQLEQVSLQRNRLKEDNHQQIKDFFKSKAQAYENLQKVISNPMSEFQHIHLHIQDMLDRFGTSGTERIAVINYYMNEILEVLVSDLHKYFLNSSVFNEGFTAQNPPKPIDSDVLKILNLDSTRICYFTKKYKERFMKETSVFKDMTQQFYQIFKNIQSQGKVIEHLFTDLMKELDYNRLGQLIIWFEENKFCKEVKRVRREWINMLKTDEQVKETIRKKTKQE